jgi:hypothetical protein
MRVTRAACTQTAQYLIDSHGLASEYPSLVVYWTPAGRPIWNQHPAGIDLNSLPRQPACVSGPPLFRPCVTVSGLSPHS